MAVIQTLVIKPFDALSLRELHACLKLRGEVFVVGQQICAVPDADELDPVCQHALLWVGDELVGTARLLVTDGSLVKVGRVAIAEAHRGKGLGAELMRAVQGWIGQVPGRSGLMHAQTYLTSWYERLGWRAEGAAFVEAGIDHKLMRYPAEDA